MSHDKEERTIVIHVIYEKGIDCYSVEKEEELCEIVGRCTEEPLIYVKKKEHPHLRIVMKLCTNWYITGLCFSKGNSGIEPRPSDSGNCGEGFVLTKPLVPEPNKDGLWEAVIANEAPDLEHGYYDLTLFPEGRGPIDPRVYNHGRVGDDGLLKRLLAWIRRLIRALRRFFQ